MQTPIEVLNIGADVAKDEIVLAESGHCKQLVGEKTQAQFPV